MGAFPYTVPCWHMAEPAVAFTSGKVGFHPTLMAVWREQGRLLSPSNLHSFQAATPTPSKLLPWVAFCKNALVGIWFRKPTSKH